VRACGAYDGVTVHRDFAGRERYVMARKHQPVPAP
jgi:hypothetical protein